MLRNGLDAFLDKRYEVAVPLLECVEMSNESSGQLYAKFYLASIAADDGGRYVDHPRAYALYQSLADGADAVDREDNRRIPFIAKSVTAIAGYVRRGLPEIGLKSDLERSLEYYRFAANIFNEPDAQFELTKIFLCGSSADPSDVQLALRYLQKLARDGHAGAQANLAQLHWTGTYLQKDRPRSLALMMLAVENAAPSDALWIEDRYQDVYCGSVPNERMRAIEILQILKRVTTPRAKPPGRGQQKPMFSFKCSNGEPIDLAITK